MGVEECAARRHQPRSYIRMIGKKGEKDGSSGDEVSLLGNVTGGDISFPFRR